MLLYYVLTLQYDIMGRHAVLCYAMWCYTFLCVYVLLCCAMRFFVVLCASMRYYAPPCEVVRCYVEQCLCFVYSYIQLVCKKYCIICHVLQVSSTIPERREQKNPVTKKTKAKKNTKRLSTIKQYTRFFVCVHILCGCKFWFFLRKICFLIYLCVTVFRKLSLYYFLSALVFVSISLSFHFALFIGVREKWPARVACLNIYR